MEISNCLIAADVDVNRFIEYHYFFFATIGLVNLMVRLTQEKLGGYECVDVGITARTLGDGAASHQSGCSDGRANSSG